MDTNIFAPAVKRLETTRLILRPWLESDAASLYEYAKDPAVGPIAGWPVHTSVENSRDIIRNVLSAPETYAVCLKTDNRAIGCVGLQLGENSSLVTAENEGEIGYWLGVPYWGQGLIPEAVNELLRYGFEELHLTNIWCAYFDGNDRSRRVQEKCCFVYHHTNRDIYWELMDDIRTEHVSCLSRESWQALHGIIETPRLRMRKMTQADYPALCRILQDEEVMYAYEGAFTGDEVQTWLDRQLARYENDGFGLNAVILKETGELIGQCGLTVQDIPDKKVLEVGYLFQKKFWHQGYAAEAATACRDYAFNVLNAGEVYSIIRDSNTASQKVALRNGMSTVGSFVKHYKGVDMPHYIFRVTRDSLN